uniref:Uncharacterized protein n=1 Tax=Magallana gigas TaxID=29159 RepID=A0A8W8L671_MAGGI
MVSSEFLTVQSCLLEIGLGQQSVCVVGEYQSLSWAGLCHTYYLRASLRMLVKYFSPPIVKSVEEGVMRSDKDRRLLSNVHMVLKAILDSVPIIYLWSQEKLMSSAIAADVKDMLRA